jgi:hypothetical protein
MGRPRPESLSRANPDFGKGGRDPVHRIETFTSRPPGIPRPVGVSSRAGFPSPASQAPPTSETEPPERARRTPSRPRPGRSFACQTHSAVGRAEPRSVASILNPKLKMKRWDDPALWGSSRDAFKRRLLPRSRICRAGCPRTAPSTRDYSDSVNKRRYKLTDALKSLYSCFRASLSSVHHVRTSRASVSASIA